MTKDARRRSHRRCCWMFVCILGQLTAAGSWVGAVEVLDGTSQGWTVRQVTTGPAHHFFGYYGISPWNLSGKHLVCLESNFQDHLPAPDESAAICLIDATTGEMSRIATTNAWNLQQGAMLHWHPRASDSIVLYNERRGNRVAAIALNVQTGVRREYERAISGISPDGRCALSLNYGRLQRLRKVVGYRGIADPNPTAHAPDNDGVFVMDLQTGKTRLVVSIRSIYDRMMRTRPDMQGADVWFNHTVVDPGSSRFFFLVRAKVKGMRRQNAMYTAQLDGSAVRQLVPFGRRVSHFAWRNATDIVVTHRRKNVTVPDGPQMAGHFLYSVSSSARPRLLAGDWLQTDGHCTFDPTGTWLATDPHGPEPHARQLLLYNLRSDVRIRLGIYPLGKYAHGDLRCDLHPRWKPSGDAVCFDAIVADGTRQLHVATRK